MVSALQAVLIWAVVFTVLIFGAQRLGYLKNKLGGAPPFFVLIRTSLGIDFLDRLAKRGKRGWRAWGVLGVIFALIGMVLGIGFVAFGAINTFLQPEAGLQDPANALVIPGVSDFLPLAAAAEIVIGLLLALVVHEGGHGLMCRLGDIDIDSTGILAALGIPIGAFVEPDQESQEAASRLNRIRMASAGIMNNVALTVIAFVLLVGPMTAFIAPASGAAVGGVFPNSPAEEAGLEKGDRIVAVNGEEVTTAAEANDAIHAASDPAVTVTLADGTTTELNRGLLITEAAERVDGLTVGSTVTSVNGEPVNTRSEYQDAIAATSGDTITLGIQDQNGETRTVEVPAGVPVQVAEDGQLAASGAPTSTAITITAINGEQIHTVSELQTAVQDAGAGSTIEVTALVAGEQQTYTTTVSGDGTIGVEAQAGLGSLSVSDTGIRYYPAERFLNILSLGGGDLSIVEKFLVFIFLPAAGQAGLFNFAGFTPVIQNFYTVAVPDFLVGVWFFTANVLFWTAWININLALFNCIPTYGLDGGHILRDGVGEVIERLGGNPDGSLHSVLTHSVRGALVLGLFMLLFGGIILSAI